MTRTIMEIKFLYFILCHASATCIITVSLCFYMSVFSVRLNQFSTVSQAQSDVTFAGAIRPAEHRALLYAAERLEHLSHVAVCLLFSQHAHEQLPVF